MAEAEARKIAPHHLEREACLYVRQSSLRQVMQNTESTRRQYGLSQRATALGWPTERIRVIDEDQGKSGAYSGNRSGFRDLMGSIAAGEVGIVLGLEVSRLARDNADWHQMLRIAGITNTLILDETGIYDPNDVNDKLLLGVKGTLSEFELQGIKARLLGGQRSAAARGALKMRLPVGLAYNDRDEVVFDPDRSVVDAIRLVFDSFRRMGSAKAVMKWMHRENIALPSSPRSGPAHGEPHWTLPRLAQVGRILGNPRYAGTYVYGRKQVERRADGTEIRHVMPMEDWRVCIPDAHVGFIDWEEYLRNQATLTSNAAAFRPLGSRTAAPREGAALLQSRVICGHCGRRMGMRNDGRSSLEGDRIVRIRGHGRAVRGPRRRGVVAVGRLVQELDAPAGDQQNLGGEPVRVLAVLAPLAGLHLARDVDQPALLRVLLQHVDQAVLEGDDPVPLGLVDPLAAGVPVYVALVGRDAQVGHAAPGGEMVDGDVGAEAADQFRAIESEAHGLLLQVWLMTMEYERRGRLSPPPSPFTLPALHSNSGLTPDPVSEEKGRCGSTSEVPHGVRGDSTITRSAGESPQTQQGAS